MSGEGLVKQVVPVAQSGAASGATTTNAASQDRINTYQRTVPGTSGAINTIEREYQNFEAEELDMIEQQDVASKMRLLGKERKSATIDRSEALL